MRSIKVVILGLYFTLARMSTWVSRLFTAAYWSGEDRSSAGQAGSRLGNPSRRGMRCPHMVDLTRASTIGRGEVGGDGGHDFGERLVPAGHDTDSGVVLDRNPA